MNFGKTAVEQALRATHGEHYAWHGALATPAHDSPEWTTLEDEIRKAGQRAMVYLESDLQEVESRMREMERKIQEGADPPEEYSPLDAKRDDLKKLWMEITGHLADE